MRFKRLLPILLSVTTSVFTLSGCSDFDNDWTANEIMYKESFAKTFGKIDPEQDWNLASRAGVTVTTSSPKDIKVYAFTDGKYKLVADYANVSGTKTLGFDVREDVCELMVTDGSQSYRVKPGESVSFGMATRAIYGTEGDDAIVSVEDYVEFDADKYVGTVVEKDTGILPEEKANLDKVVQNFSYISNGPFTIHPIYWNSSSSHILGVYWKENGVYRYQDVYKNKDAVGKEVATRTYSARCEHQFKRPTVGMTCQHSHGTIGEIIEEGDGSYSLYDTDGNLMSACTNDHFPKIYQAGDICPTCGKILHVDMYGNKFTHIDYVGLAGSEANQNGLIYSKGITINLPAGTLFGFYMKVITNDTEYTHTLYSQGELNEIQKGDFFDTTSYPTKSGCSVTTDGKNHEGTTAWAATFQTEVDGQTVQYLCFEDWSNNRTDLNDLVFATPVTDGNTPPSIVNEDADTWIICAEDLGNTFDLDYNDVVVEVSHVSGKDKATITPIAAGGTLASYIYFNNGTEDKCLGEVHELLGQEKAASGKYTPINADGKLNTSICQNIEVSVSPDWSIASSAVGDASFAESSASEMGGFYLKVVPEGTASTEENATASTQTIKNTFIKGENNVPFVFCVPRDWERTDGTVKYSGWFRWSKEMVPMSSLEGYEVSSYNTPEHTFAAWVEDHTKAIDWYKFPNLETTMGIKGITTSSANSEPNSGSGPTGPTTTQGITIGSTLSAQDAIFGYHYEIIVSDGTFDTTKGGKITVTYSSQPSGNSYIATPSGTLVSGNNETVTGCKFSVNLDADKIASIKNGFWVGNYSSDQSTIKSIIYTPAE